MPATLTPSEYGGRVRVYMQALLLLLPIQSCSVAPLCRIRLRHIGTANQELRRDTRLVLGSPPDVSPGDLKVTMNDARSKKCNDSYFTHY